MSPFPPSSGLLVGGPSRDHVDGKFFGTGRLYKEIVALVQTPNGEAGETCETGIGGAGELAMDIEDLEPKNKLTKLKELSGWNIEDLAEYIERLEGEITRARAMIESKRNINSVADALFKR